MRSDVERLWKKSTTRQKIKYAVIVFLIIWILVAVYAKAKPLPDGISVEGTVYNVSDIKFLYDLNYLEGNETVIEQEIFDEVLSLVDSANKFIVIDMFLFNTDYSEKVRYRNITTELKNALIEKKKKNPDMQITFISDEINNFYGDFVSKEFQEMADNNISVVITDLTELRDVNFIYAGFWRAYVQWFGTAGWGWLPHPLGKLDEKVTLRSYLKLMNTKANHRKVIVADYDDSVVAIVTSANPHEASGKHSNIGVRINGGIYADILQAESAVEKFSGYEGTIQNIIDGMEYKETSGDIQVQLLTEQKIRDKLIAEINRATSTEEIEMVMFYLSDRKVVNALLEASERGVNISIILDPNKDAFAREKSGIPNRQVAYELVKESGGKINIKWYDTKGEQQHSKITIIRKSDGTIIVFLGSANLTKRNIGNFNLEMDVKIISPEGEVFTNDVLSYFDMIWNNKNGHYTTNYEAYEDTSIAKYWLYRFQEASGFSSF